MLHQCHTDVTLPPLFVFHPLFSISLYLNIFHTPPSSPFVFSPLNIIAKEVGAISVKLCQHITQRSICTIVARGGLTIVP